MADGIDREELRRLVRDVLRSTLSEGTVASPGEPESLLDRMRQAILPGAAGVVTVGDDLGHFAQTIIHASGQEDLKAAIMSGRLTFKRNSDQQKPARRSENPVASSGGFRLDHGILGETRLAEIGKSHTKIIIGPDVVVTPLARDRARELKLELVRAKP